MERIVEIRLLRAGPGLVLPGPAHWCLWGSHFAVAATPMGSPAPWRPNSDRWAPRNRWARRSPAPAARADRQRQEFHGWCGADASVHRRRLLGLVYGLYGRFRGAIPIAFYVRVQSRAALKTNRLCSSRAAPGSGLPILVENVRCRGTATHCAGRGGCTCPIASPWPQLCSSTSNHHA